MNKTDRWISQCDCGVDTMSLKKLDENQQQYLLKRKGYATMLEEANWHDSFILKEPFKHIDSDYIDMKSAHLG